MNYIFNRIKLNNSTVKYTIDSGGEKLTYRGFIEVLKAKDEEFLGKFKDELNNASSELSAYFWECVPVSINTIDKEFEFVLVKSKSLDNIQQDYSSYQEYFSKNQDNQVVSFPSFSGDMLVVPTPKETDYKNISKFAENSQLEQWETFWQKVGEKMEENLISAGGKPRWLSTSGLGVSYLHVRIDKRPKYYSHNEYMLEQEYRLQQEISLKINT